MNQRMRAKAFFIIITVLIIMPTAARAAIPPVAGQKTVAEIGFPYTAENLLVVSFSTGFALVALGLGLKILMNWRRQ